MVLDNLNLTTTTGPDHKVEGPLTRVGLKDVEVNAICNESEEMLVFTNDGIFIHRDGDLNQFGLKGKSVIDITSIGTGKFLAAVYTIEELEE